MKFCKLEIRWFHMMGNQFHQGLKIRTYQHMCSIWMWLSGSIMHFSWTLFFRTFRITSFLFLFSRLALTSLRFYLWLLVHKPTVFGSTFLAQFILFELQSVFIYTECCPKLKASLNRWRMNYQRIRNSCAISGPSLKSHLCLKRL